MDPGRVDIQAIVDLINCSDNNIPFSGTISLRHLTIKSSWNWACSFSKSREIHSGACWTLFQYKMRWGKLFFSFSLTRIFPIHTLHQGINTFLAKTSRKKLFEFFRNASVYSLESEKRINKSDFAGDGSEADISSRFEVIAKGLDWPHVSRLETWRNAFFLDFWQNK